MARTIRTTRRTDLAPILAARDPFANSTGSLCGAPRLDANTVGFGWLNTEERARFWDDAPHIRYIVWSYATPIAWLTESGEWYEVAQRFSQTTGRHQSQVRRGIANLRASIAEWLDPIIAEDDPANGGHGLLAIA